MIFLDTETCGLTGPIVLIQYADSDGPVILHNVWLEPIRKTLQLIEWICKNEVCAYNLSFDWFHINKLYNLFKFCTAKNLLPNISNVVGAHKAKYAEYCLKPKSALDLFLHIRRTPWQTLMDRRNIIIRKVPKEISGELCNILRRNIPLEDIYFTKSSTGYQWKAEPYDESFDNIVLRFKPSAGLKPLMKHLFGKSVLDLPIPKVFQPEEQSYNPYNLAWVPVIHHHIQAWMSKQAKTYAENDILYLRELWEYYQKPQPGDLDSQLAVCIGAVRWKGFAIDEKAIRNHIKMLQDFTPKLYKDINIHSSQQVLTWIRAVATLGEKICIQDTAAETLEEIAKWPRNVKIQGCCNSPGARAEFILEARKNTKELDNLNKLLETGRFCPDFKILGTRSGRMSGGSDIGIKGGSLNPQGMQHQKDFRSLFTLADRGEVLSGGDFEAFEVTIAHAASKDTQLEHDLNSGQKFHAVFGQYLYDMSQEDLLATKGTDDDKYLKAKSSAFGGIFYGGMPPTIARTAGVEIFKAMEAMEAMAKRYPGFAAFKVTIEDAFCSMKQPGGLGTRVIWHESAETISSLLSYTRWFTLENKICKALFTLAEGGELPKTSSNKVTRRERLQTKEGATRSALYAAAFNLQAQNMRAALNHVIQSTGAEITKELQLAIWDLQPKGIGPWSVRPFQVHDEVMVVHDQLTFLKLTVKQTVEKFREIVPLLGISWSTNLQNWGEK